MTKLYLAYGSNMNKAQMARRCPRAKALRAIVVDDARLVFRGVADIEFCAGESVPVVLWEITDECERALDKFEGVASGVYEKKSIPLDNGEQALTYVMCTNGIYPPTREYYDRIKRGYEDFGLDFEPLEVALKHSHVNQKHSSETRRRHVRNVSSGNVLVARKPTNIPLSRVQDNRDEAARRRHVEDFDTCKHGWPLGVCEDCNEAALQAQPGLPFHRPAVRPMEGYNYSRAAIQGSRKILDAEMPAKSAAVSKVVTETETEATRTGKVRMNGGKRSNTKTTKTKNKNLSDWMKERGYSYK